MALPDTLTREIGGQPVYIWVTGGVIVIGGVILYRKSRGAAGGATDTASSDTYSSDYSKQTGSAGGDGSGGITYQYYYGGQPGGAGSTAPVPETKGTQPVAEPKTPSTGTAGGSNAAKMFPAGTVLRQGSTGKLVKALQNALIRAGFNSGSVDGVYGSQTAKAVKAYQRSRGLNVDAVAGSATLGALMAGKGAVQAKASEPVKPKVRMAAPSEGGWAA
jgi:hypothetical protein